MSIAPSLSYSQWISWLETRHTMPQIAPGLERTIAALKHAELYNKNSSEHTIHIAGTNGKGTTAKALEYFLKSAGETVGLYTSPHLVTTRERIVANGKMITEEEFCFLCEKHLATIEAFNLTHFECLTLFALDYFLNIQKTKWMIFEIGLGGLWDATNAIPHNTSIITTIGYDHMHILGNTLPEIARNKFGIIQKNNLVIHQTYPEDVDELLATTIKKQQARSVRVTPFAFKVTPQLIPQYSIIYNQQDIPLSLPGARAVENISTAIIAFSEIGFNIPLNQALQSLSWPARMTRLEYKESLCPIYLSGDHNLQGVDSLCEILNYSNYKRLRIILGLSKNRAHEPFVEKLSSLRSCEIYFTQPQFQGVAPDLSKHTPYFESPLIALRRCLEGLTENDLVVVTGSLYLCGELMSATKKPDISS